MGDDAREKGGKRFAELPLVLVALSTQHLIFFTNGMDMAD